MKKDVTENVVVERYHRECLSTAEFQTGPSRRDTDVCSKANAKFPLYAVFCRPVHVSSFYFLRHF